MKYILGIKKEMTRRFLDSGEVVPVTVVKTGAFTVTQVKTKESKDGYNAVQIGFGEKKKITKPLSGHLKDLGKFRFLKEFKTENPDNFQIGQNFNAEIFEVGEKVNISGITKGRGFQGVVKRHKFAGGKASHGHKDQLRMPGSIGAGGPARVFLGKRMGGHMGVDQVTIKGLEIIDINKDKNLIYIKGAVPGAKNSLLEIFTKGEISPEKLIKQKEAEVKAKEETVINQIEELKENNEASATKEVTTGEEEKKQTKEEAALAEQKSVEGDKKEE